VPSALRDQARLALVWFLYMAGFGLYFPYWSLYLKENAGLTAGKTGMVLAVLSLMGILSQPFWGQIADRTGSRTRVLTGIIAGASIGFVGLYVARGFGGLLLANAFFAGFHTAVIPMTVAVSLATLRDAGPHAFGLVRSVGTIGFLLTAKGFQLLLDRVQESRGWEAEPGGPTEPGLELFFLAAAVIVVAAAIVARGLPRAGAVSIQAGRGDWRALVRHRPYVRVAGLNLVAYFLMHSPMLFFPLLVTEYGGDAGTISNLWIPMVALEIPGLMLSGWLVQRFGPRGLMAIGLGAAGVRWLACGLFPSIEVFYVTCLLHGVTIAGLMMGSPLYVEAAVPERLRSTGQGMIATCIHLGAMLSSIVMGQLVDREGIELPYVLGGGAVLVLLCAMPWILPEPHRPEEPEEIAPAT
jgi:PPP family 3-phenylpropionic acid transporter